MLYKTILLPAISNEHRSPEQVWYVPLMVQYEDQLPRDYSLNFVRNCVIIPLRCCVG